MLASVAAAWGVGTPWETVMKALGPNSDASSAPGPSTLSYRGATVIADYGHNPDAIAALASAVQAMPARKRSVVISGAGDRRDEDITQQTAILAACLTTLVRRHVRADGEVLGLLPRAGRPTQTTYIQEIQANSSPSTPPLPACNPATQ